MLLTVTQPNSWEHCPVLLLGQTWALLEALRAHTPQPSCVIWTHFRAKTSPPSPRGWAHAHYTCGRTRFPPQISWYPHACIFTHARATGHTPAWWGARSRRHRTAGRQRTAATLLHPSLTHIWSALKETASSMPKKHCASLSLVPLPARCTHRQLLGGDVSSQHHVLLRSPAPRHEGTSKLPAWLRVAFRLLYSHTGI